MLGISRVMRLLLRAASSVALRKIILQYQPRETNQLWMAVE